MWAYFKPLRRKIGVMLLVISCLLTVGWIRSQIIMDEILVRKSSQGTAEVLVSVEGSLGRMSANPPEQVTADSAMHWVWPEWNARPEGGSPDQKLFGSPDVKWTGRWCGFGSGSFTFGSPFIGYALIKFWLVPYWSITIPMALMSAWLLLSRPRLAKSELTQT